jgi:hypothetical protein
MSRIQPYAKAVASGLASALAFAIPVIDDGLVPSEGLGIGLAFLVGLGVTYAVPNKPQA